MNSRVHFWIVCDAVAYIKHHGDAAHREALQAFQSAYGEDKPVQEIPVHRSAVEYLVGFEAWHTDKFGDLALQLRGLPWGAKNGITGLGWHMFTAFNHFINPFPGNDNPWPKADGYAYDFSSRTGFDSIVVGGISEYLRGLVDADRSLVLERLRPAWLRGPEGWRANFQGALRETLFAPWTALAPLYYSHLLLNHFEPLEVRGPNQHIVGLQLLGPICHAVTDACSIQHVRPALGFGHQAWENYIQSRVYTGRIGMDPSVVSLFLRQASFNLDQSLPDGPLSGTLDVGAFVHALSMRTAKRLGQSTASTWRQLWQSGEQFWKSYLTGQAMRDDSFYLYNQAVAGTVHLILRSYEDLMRLGVLDQSGSLKSDGELPDLPLCQDALPRLPSKQEDEATSPESFRRVPFQDAQDLLGFEPTEGSRLPALLETLDNLMHDRPLGPASRTDLRHILTSIEAELILQYRGMESREGPGFCPMRAIERLPVESDLSAHFGTGTYRLPSEDECDDAQLFAQYLERIDSHAEKARLLQLTQAAAGLKYYRAGSERRTAESEALDDTISRIDAARFGTSGADVARAAEMGVQVHSHTESRLSGRNVLGRLTERISSFFNAPMTGLATAAAIALLLIMVYPRGAPEVIIGLSQNQWSVSTAPKYQAKSLGLFDQTEPSKSKPRVMPLALFEGFGPRVDQSAIDEVYMAIQPVTDLEAGVVFIDPAEVQAAVRQRDIETKRASNLIRDLRKPLRVSFALVVCVTANEETYSVSVRLFSLSTGKDVALDRTENVPKGRLKEAVTDSTLKLFGTLELQSE